MCNENERRWQILQAPLVLLMLTTLCSLAQAEPDRDRNYAPRTVQEMLDIDSRLALQREQQREREAMGLKATPLVPGPVLPTPALAEPLPDMQPLAAPVKTAVDKPAAPTPPKPITIALDGIFGLGDRLFADVRIDGQRVRFQRGHRYPLGYERGFAYGLIAINVPCVRLAGPQGAQTLCIQPFED